MKFLNPGMFALALLCFLLPFTNFQCNKQKVASFKGYNLIRNANFSEAADGEGMMSGMMDRMKSSAPSSNDKPVMEFPLLAVAIILLSIGIVTLILTLNNKSERVISIWSIVSHSIVLLLLFLEMAVMEFAMRKANQEIESKSDGDSPFAMKFDWGLEIGYYLLLLITVGMIIYNIVMLKKKPVYVAEPSPAPAPPPYQGPDNMIG